MVKSGPGLLFQVQPYQESSELERLMSSMKEFYNDPKKSYPLTLEDLNKDQFFAARHTDSLWYRVKINSQLVTTFSLVLNLSSSPF